MFSAQIPTNASSRRAPRITIQKLRSLITAVLVISVISFTGGVFVLVQRIFDNFGPAVEKDLDWNTERSARELGLSTDLGLALGDAAIVSRSFKPYEGIKDVIAIVAVDNEGKVVASRGKSPEPLPVLFGGPPITVRSGATYRVAWDNAAVEGSGVGKVAVVISTRRLTDSQSLLRRVSWMTAGGGFLALAGGIAFVTFFTRRIAERDDQLAEYASGLEAKVAERTVELGRINGGLRTVLDNVDQGLVAITLDGVMADQRSAIVDTWFGVPEPGMTVCDYVGRVDAVASEWIAVGLQALADGNLPREVVLDQFPRRLNASGRTVSLAYKSLRIEGGDGSDRLLIVFTDITDELALEAVERDNRDMGRIFQRISRDAPGVQQFLTEADELVRRLRLAAPPADHSPEAARRLIHTLKGNCALFGIESMTALCHDIENRLQEDGGVPTAPEKVRIESQWAQVSQSARAMVGGRAAGIELETADLNAFLALLDGDVSTAELAAIARTWLNEPIGLRLARLGDKAEYLAGRLGKSPLTVHTDGADIRLDSHRWSPFWSALAHAVTNAVDHGIEDGQTRIACNKPAAGSLWFTARRVAGDLEIAVRDDGRGIDWAHVRSLAAERGLPHATHAELVEAMFADGLTTTTKVSSTSGRGVGMGALRAATSTLGGTMQVASDPGRGTTVSFRFPHQFEAGQDAAIARSVA